MTSQALKQDIETRYEIVLCRSHSFDHAALRLSARTDRTEASALNAHAGRPGFRGMSQADSFKPSYRTHYVSCFRHAFYAIAQRP